MILNKKGLKISVIDVVSVVVSVFFLVGITCWFGACGPKADGSYMNCRHAGEVVTALAAVLLALSVCKAFLPDGKYKTGVSIAMIAVGVTACFVPKGIIPLCMMDAMTCNATMKPWTTVFGALTAVVGAADCAFWLLKNKKK